MNDLARQLKSIKFLSTLILILLAAGCVNSKRQITSNICTGENYICHQGKALVDVKTTKGSFTIELYGNSAPLTVGNFLNIVKKGIYNGTAFHRVIRSPMPFIIQGGDPTSKDPNTPSKLIGLGNYIDNETGQISLIPIELKLQSEAIPRYSQLIINPNELIQLELIHQRGSVAMARSQAIDSASSQFYIALRALPELDGRYAVFGKVVKGMAIIDKIEQGDKIISAKSK